jgi:hypothetical protein
MYHLEKLPHIKSLQLYLPYLDGAPPRVAVSSRAFHILGDKAIEAIRATTTTTNTNINNDNNDDASLDGSFDIALECEVDNRTVQRIKGNSSIHSIHRPSLTCRMYVIMVVVIR